MKQMKESSAAFRKKRKARKPLIKKHQAALLKYINHQETTINIDQTSAKTQKFVNPNLYHIQKIWFQIFCQL